jgi:hypothetical protein
MGDSPVFSRVGDALERLTSLKRIEARGTVRLVLKDAGLEPGTVTVAEMQVVLERLMPTALEKRKVNDAADVCAKLTRELADHGPLEARESAYDVFRRLGGDEMENKKR